MELNHLVFSKRIKNKKKFKERKKDKKHFFFIWKISFYCILKVEKTLLDGICFELLLQQAFTYVAYKYSEFRMTNKQQQQKKNYIHSINIKKKHNKI